MGREGLVAAVAAAVAAVLLRGRPDEGGSCPADPAACHFAPSYEGARALFRARAAALDDGRACGVRSFTSRLPEVAPGLATDAAVVDRCGGAERCATLVHLSGVHGVEGFAGSAVQCALLDAWRAGRACPPPGTRAVLVHAVNPFGMHEGRRWDERNVDLNRNMLPAAAFAGLAARREAPERAYADLAELLHPRGPWREARFWLTAAASIARRGYLACKRALVAGQYSHPAGLWYGGAALATAHARVVEFLAKVVAADAPVFVVDVHTGLGPPGVDTLMVLDANATAARARRAVFGAPDGSFLYGATADAGGAAAGYDLTIGDAATGYAALLNWTRAGAVTQEFGTVPSVLVARALVRENAAWHHSDDPREKRAARRELRRAFRVPTAAWERAVVDRGLAVAGQALAGLAEGALP